MSSDYDFGSGLSADFPSQIIVDVTEFCNLACIHCPYEAVTKVKGAKRRHLDMELHRKLIDEVAQHLGTCRFLRYTGDGEPLLHPHLSEMLAHAVERTGLPVNLTTNGMLLTEEIARSLVDAGVSVIDISLDAHEEETYRRIRVKGELARTRENIHRLLAVTARSGGRTRVVVSFVLQPLNEGEVEAFRSYWRSCGVADVIIRPRHSCAGSNAAIRDAMWAEAPRVRHPCLYPWERLVVKSDGTFSYCPADWLHQADLGSLADFGVAEVWTGEKMQALRRTHQLNTFPEKSLCGRCPDWSIIRWPHEPGRNYADVMKGVGGE